MLHLEHLKFIISASQTGGSLSGQSECETFSEREACCNANTSLLFPLVAYLFLGIVFGWTLSKSEVLSWFRIQEMFQLQSFRMHRIIASAIVTAAVSLLLARRFRVKSLPGGKRSYSHSSDWGREFVMAWEARFLGWGGRSPAHVQVPCSPSSVAA